MADGAAATLAGTPPVVFGVILSVFLAFVLLGFLCCFNNLEGGSTYARKYPAKGKEFTD